MEKFDISNHLLPALSKEEIKELFEAYHQGNHDARNKLILHNLRFVYYLVYHNFLNNVRFDEMEDLISIGTIGLIKAVENFDCSKNIEFTTFATKVIFNEILYYFRKRKKWNQVQSLQQIIICNEDEHDLLLEDVIADSNYFLDAILEEYDLNEIKKLFSILNSREKEVLSLYFGLNGKRLNQYDISKRIGVSQSYISRIIKNGIQKIKKLYLTKENRSRKKYQH